MSMFLNYDNISKNYVPNNLKCSFPVGKSYTKLDPVNSSKPYEEYNVKGELIGYYWHYGETLNLEFNIDGEIVVESDAIILHVTGEEPSSITGKLLQRAYNITDKRSWTCTAIDREGRHWAEDETFQYPEEGNSIYVSAEDYLADKHVSLTIYNYRMEPIHNETFAGTPKIIFNITRELSNKMLKGIYYCSLTVFNEDVNLPIFSNSDCTLLVK